MLHPLISFFVAGFFCWFLASSLWIYPHSLSYFNETVGGPLNGSKHLLGSSVDWGQDLFYAREWAHEVGHSSIYLGSYYVGSFQNVLSQIAVPYSHPLPKRTPEVLDAIYIASINLVCGFAQGSELKDYDYLQHITSYETIGYSMQVFTNCREE
jgi:hypothetical protein